MAKRDIGTEILEGIREVKAYKSGHLQLKTRKLKNPAPTREIRRRLQLSQTAFASLMGVSLRTVQDWEQGRRSPSGPARSLLRVAEQHPEVFMKLG
jgi:putative transcriptional regulator